MARKRKTGKGKMATATAPGHAVLTRPKYGEPDFRGGIGASLEAGWRETVLRAADKAAVRYAVDRCGTSMILELRKCHLVARGDWRRAMIVKRIRELEEQRVLDGVAAAAEKAAGGSS